MIGTSHFTVFELLYEIENHMVVSELKNVHNISMCEKAFKKTYAPS